MKKSKKKPKLRPIAVYGCQYATSKSDRLRPFPRYTSLRKFKKAYPFPYSSKGWSVWDEIESQKEENELWRCAIGRLGNGSSMSVRKSSEKTAPSFLGAAVKIPLGDTWVKRQGKDREKSAKPIIPYFFLPCVGFSLHPDSRKCTFRT